MLFIIVIIIIIYYWFKILQECTQKDKSETNS